MKDRIVEETKGDGRKRGRIFQEQRWIRAKPCSQAAQSREREMPTVQGGQSKCKGKSHQSEWFILGSTGKFSIAESLGLGRSRLGGQREESHSQLNWEEQRLRGEKMRPVQREVKGLSCLGHGTP